MADLLRIVWLWNPVKQRAALNALQWIVVHKEQNSGLIDRVYDFLVFVGYVEAKKAPYAADEEALPS